jgi:nucleoside-diphosphate-sugar epimerase
MTDPYADLDINAKAQLSILEACKNYNPAAKIVFASTRQIYGRPHYLPVDERHPLQPVDVNGINKMAGEWYHMVYHQVYGIRTSVLRLTNTFGPRMRIKDARQTFLGIWIRRILEGKPIQIFGDGLQIRDYNYVEDVVAALIAAASTEEAFGKILNLGDCRRYTLLDTAKIMIDAFKGGAFQLVDFPPDRKKIDIGDYYADYSLASELLKWSPQTSLRSGIEATLGYFATRLSQYC